MLKSILLLVFLGEVANARHVACVRTEGAACWAKEVHTIPWSNENEKPGPVPECMSAFIESNEVPPEYDDYDYFDVAVNITWKQKWSDIGDLDGYFIQSTNSDIQEHIKIELNKEKLSEYKDMGERYATFTFANVDVFQYEAVYLYPMPMYTDDSQEYSLNIRNVRGKVVESKSCNTNARARVEKPTNEMPTQNQGTKDKLAEEILTGGSGRTVPNAGVKVEEPTNEIPRRNQETEKKLAVEISTEGSVRSVPMVPLRTTIMACILTSLGTLLLLGIVFIICVARHKAIGRYRKPMMVTPMKSEYFPGKQGCRGKRQPKVFILTSMAKGEDENRASVFYKKVALCLGEILRKSNDYDVSCNLWMTKEIADNGLAVWAHKMIKTHDIIIALCNKSTVAALRQWPILDFNDDQVQEDMEPSVQILHRLIGDVSSQKLKVIIACVEEGRHDCLAYLSLDGSQRCGHFNLTYQFPEFINALNPKGQYLRGNTTATMRKLFLEMLQKNRSNYEQTCFPNENVSRTEAFAPKYELIPREPPNCEKFCCIDGVGPAAINVASPSKEIQYDSVFSSRCNSHSTETLSSCEDTGFNEKDHKNVKNFSMMGARPKAQLA